MKFINNSLRLGAVGGLLCAALALPGLASAQLAAEIEGRIDADSVQQNGNGATMTVMGIPVVITDTTTIHSPSNENLRDLSGAPSGLVDTTSLPYRTNDRGFEGGTAIVIGSTRQDQNGVFEAIVADDVFVEPAENVALGVITKADPNAELPSNGTYPAAGALLVNGVPLNFLDDERIPFKGAIDLNGFPITDFNLITDGGAAAVAGYYAGGYLNIFELEADAILPPGEDAVSIERTRCRTGNRLETRGVTSADGLNGETVTLTYEGDSNFQVTVSITPDALGGGTYAHRQAIGVCPATVTAVLDNTAATATATVEQR